MKTILIKPHSIVDVITNSSSELFVCKTDKEIQIVKELLQDMLNIHNKCYNSDIQFEEAFDEPYMIDHTNVDQFIKDYVIDWEYEDYRMKVKVPNFYYEAENKFPSNYSLPNEERAKIHKKQQEYEEQMREEFLKKHGDYLKQYFIGQIVINSQSSNSIPYELFDLIENAFNAHRRHLG
jgi:hypothetical protein